MPSAVSVVGSAGLITIPPAVSPAAASTAHHRADSDADAEPDNACGNHGASGRGRGIRRDYVWVAIDDRWVIYRNVNDLGIGRLDHNHLWRLLYHRNLGSSL